MVCYILLLCLPDDPPFHLSSMYSVVFARITMLRSVCATLSPRRCAKAHITKTSHPAERWLDTTISRVFQLRCYWSDSGRKTQTGVKARKSSLCKSLKERVVCGWVIMLLEPQSHNVWWNLIKAYRNPGRDGKVTSYDFDGWWQVDDGLLFYLFEFFLEDHAVKIRAIFWRHGSHHSKPAAVLQEGLGLRFLWNQHRN